MGEGIVSLPVRSLIARVRRQRGMARATRWALVAAFVSGVIVSGSPRYGQVGTGIVMAVVAWWMLLSVRTARNQQSALSAGPLVEAGRFDEAEQAIGEGLSRFSLYRGPKQASLHNLAAMRFAQHRYQDAADLAIELLTFARSPQQRRSLNLMLAECALELDHLPTAQTALSAVAGEMPLRDTLKLMELQVEYCVKIAAWPQATEHLPLKAELSELLPAEPAQRVQALMALAAMKQGKGDWSTWLRRRAELLGDIDPLLRRRPVLQELFGTSEPGSS
jgi:hypothetical protein